MKLNPNIKRWMKFITSLTLGLALLSIPHITSAQAIDTYAPVSPSLQRAAIIYNRITGVKKGIDQSPIPEMAALVAAGQGQQAAALATAEAAFYNNTVRLMGQRMSTKDDTYKAPFSDTAAMLIGITKDDLDARELLTSDSFYTVNLPNIPSDLRDDILSSNDHYEGAYNALLQDNTVNIANSLTRQPQSIRVGDAVQAHPAASGILSLRQFNSECSNMGTNRLCYEQTFKKFMCVGLEDFTDSTAPDARVAIDVTRAPGNDPNLFQTTCRGCHGNMDAMRGAFARVEFDDNFVKEGSVSNDNLFDNNNVSTKFNRGVADGFAGGYRTTDNSWINQATGGALGDFFGWRSPAGERLTTNIQGTGLRPFGSMIANSEAFSRCLVKQVYKSVCGREVDVSESAWTRNIASEFEVQGRKVKWLFERVASDSACIGR